MAESQKPADVSEHVSALGIDRDHRFVDCAAHLCVSTVPTTAHLGFCTPAPAKPDADRSLSGSIYGPEVSRDGQRGVCSHRKDNQRFKGAN